MNDTERLAELISQGGVVFFGGAGVSTESGIPDFRSEAGLYAAESVYGHSPEKLLSHTFFIREPETFFRYYKENLISLEALPNAAHLALAELERRGLVTAVITQNIDGLHSAAGSAKVLELHGSNLRQYCMKCGAKYSLDYVMDSADIVPKCEKCDGTVRPDVVLYEESLDDDVMREAVRCVENADTLIVGGTSLAVHPAAGLLRYYDGRSLVLINKSETTYDVAASIIIRRPIGEVFAEVMQNPAIRAH
ncbi:MAG: NAD-dependent protein deacylase [Oscillospiraceae bacterium]|jgi:NAD-dependent deacetylase|nr:NAD-dependent protein deacylase [Oscillospiraceae bacterium]